MVFKCLVNDLQVSAFLKYIYFDTENLLLYTNTHLRYPDKYVDMSLITSSRNVADRKYKTALSVFYTFGGLPR